VRETDSGLAFSPTDLCTFSKSPFASWMDRWYLSVAGRQPAPFSFDGEVFPDCAPDEQEPEMEILSDKGMEHEKRFLEKLREGGKSVVELDSRDLTLTREALASGADVIYQAWLESADGLFGGYADFLVRTGSSADRTPLYEAWDTKLARSTKPTFILQLCLYSEMLADVQGVLPERIGVVLGTGELKTYPLNRFLHLHRVIKQRFLDFQDAFDPENLAHPAGSREHGRWSNLAERILENLDHLCRVANITRGQIRKLEAAGITRLGELAETGARRVPGLAPHILSRLKLQASLQILSEGKDVPEYRVAPLDPDAPRRGLAGLPPASPMDVFFDLEGYPHAEGGLEYLWGTVTEEEGKPVFRDWWAHDPAQEKAAFEGFMDWVMERFRADPSMHVYHYAPYETAVVRRLSGKYATREEEVDELLRNQVFVDLYPVVRQGLVVGTRGYSLKDVEHLYRGRRGGEVVNAGASVVAYHDWIASGEPPDWQDSPLLRQIRDYNEEDCVSTWELAVWLRQRQAEAGIAWAGPESDDEEKPKRLLADTDNSFEERKARRRELPEKLDRRCAGSPEKERARLLGGLAGYHWREAKPVFWRKFDRAVKTHEELAEDLDCLGFLELEGYPRPDKRSLVYTYAFDPGQDTKLQEDKYCFVAADLSLKPKLQVLDRENGRAVLRIGNAKGILPPLLSLLPNEYVNADVIEDALHEVAEGWAEGNVPAGAVGDLLSAAAPRMKDGFGPFLHRPERGLPGIIEAASNLGDSVLAIQGPPGSGKTYTASRIIAELAARGRTVGVTATSHKAILNLLRAVTEALEERDIKVPVYKAGGDPDDPLFAAGKVQPCANNELAGCVGSKAVILGATAWGFARPEMRGMVDTLFIDEAGQFALANAVAVATSARNVILLGDQMQLSQPVQGTHPGNCGLSCLEHLLGEHATVPPDRGVFLETTRRLHPAICSFVSEAFYEGRLQPLAGLENQKIVPGAGRCPGWLTKEAGLLFVPVAHEGNSQASDEEADVIARLAADLLRCTYTDAAGKTRPVALEDLLFVAPYNMQVRKLKDRLGSEARVGSVDRFQGQEAPVVILSMCSSSREDSPRGMEFLCDPNRLNVAISRAQALAVVVGSPDLLSGEFGNLKEMELGNLYAWIMDRGRN